MPFLFSISMTTAVHYKEIQLFRFGPVPVSPGRAIQYVINKRPNAIRLIGLQNSEKYHRETGGIQQIQQPTTAGCKAEMEEDGARREQPNR